MKEVYNLGARVCGTYKEVLNLLEFLLEFLIAEKFT